MQLDLVYESAPPPELIPHGPCGMCGSTGPTYGVIRRSLLATLLPPPARATPARRARDAAYLPLHFTPDPVEIPTAGLCYRHTVAVVQMMRSWGDPPDGYAWVPDGLLAAP